MSNTHQRFCTNGHASPAGSRFCNTCGQPLSESRLETHPENVASTAVASGDDGVELADPTLLAPNVYIQPPPTELSRSDTAVANSVHCSGCGQRFETGQYVCEHCQTIKPLTFDHYVDPARFQWALDGQAMAKLRSIKPLVAVATQVSKQVGRPWIEANFNGIRLSTKQMPRVYAMAVQAARILGLRRMPSVYVSGARPWDAMTFGSNDDAFVVMGSALVSCFQKGDLMFLFAREMGHILAGHALWKTVIQFCVGEQNAASTMMRNGIAGLLDPFKLLESAVELPLIAWARQAEITADRAGLLASAGLAQARRTMMMWSLRSPMLYRQINIDAWLEQQAEDTANTNVRLAEAVSSATPYLTRRVKLLQDFEGTSDVTEFRQKIMSAFMAQKAENQRLAETQRSVEKQSPRSSKTDQDPGVEVVEPDSASPATTTRRPETPRLIQFPCPACQQRISLAADQFDGKTAVAVRCPKAECKKITRVAIPSPKDTSGQEGTNEDVPMTSNESLSQMGG